MVVGASVPSSAMNAKIIGSGELTLVLAHGYGGNQSLWDGILPDLSQRYQILVFDWNFSSAMNHSAEFSAAKYSNYEAFSDDLISLMDEMNLKAVGFIGHSMSGMIGCIASIKRPDLFRHLVLLGASPRYLNSEDYEGGFERSDVENIFSNIESNFQSWAWSFATLVVGAHHPVSVEKFGKSIERMRPEIALSLARTIFLSDYRGVLERVEAPCTIVQGTSDIVVPVSVGHFMLGKIKGKATLELIESDGHFPQFTAKKVLIDILDRALGYYSH